MIKFKGFFAYIHATWRHIKWYGPKWHNLTSSGCQISILQVRGPKWHLGTSSRTAGVFNSFFYIHDLLSGTGKDGRDKVEHTFAFGVGTTISS